MKKCLNFIKGFSGRSYLQLNTLRYISKKLLVQDEEDELKDTFFAMNTSFTGDLSRKELLEAFWKYGHKEMDAWKLDNIFAQLDDDNSGLLSFNEFLVPSIDPMVSLCSNEKLWIAFKDIE
jgi:Ca2+-binding EF-hand superfamily protein